MVGGFQDADRARRNRVRARPSSTAAPMSPGRTIDTSPYRISSTSESSLRTRWRSQSAAAGARRARSRGRRAGGRRPARCARQRGSASARAAELRERLVARDRHTLPDLTRAGTSRAPRRRRPRGRRRRASPRARRAGAHPGYHSAGATTRSPTSKRAVPPSPPASTRSVRPDGKRHDRRIALPHIEHDEAEPGADPARTAAVPATMSSALAAVTSAHGRSTRARCHGIVHRTQTRTDTSATRPSSRRRRATSGGAGTRHVSHGATCTSAAEDTSARAAACGTQPAACASDGTTAVTRHGRHAADLHDRHERHGRKVEQQTRDGHAGEEERAERQQRHFRRPRTQRASATAGRRSRGPPDGSGDGWDADDDRDRGAKRQEECRIDERQRVGGENRATPPRPVRSRATCADRSAVAPRYTTAIVVAAIDGAAAAGKLRVREQHEDGRRKAGAPRARAAAGRPRAGSRQGWRCCRRRWR